jgi:hypothetical protein
MKTVKTSSFPAFAAHSANPDSSPDILPGKVTHDPKTGQLLYNGGPVPKGYALRLLNPGKYARVKDDGLVSYVPERGSHLFAMHPQHWRDTFRGLTMKRPEHLSDRGFQALKPQLIRIRPGSLVGDMSHATMFYNDMLFDEAQRRLAGQNYRGSVLPFENAEPHLNRYYRQPELLIPRTNAEWAEHAKPKRSKPTRSMKPLTGDQLSLFEARSGKTTKTASLWRQATEGAFTPYEPASPQIPPTARKGKHKPLPMCPQLVNMAWWELAHIDFRKGSEDLEGRHEENTDTDGIDYFGGNHPEQDSAQNYWHDEFTSMEGKEGPKSHIQSWYGLAGKLSDYLPPEVVNPLVREVYGRMRPAGEGMPMDESGTFPQWIYPASRVLAKQFHEILSEVVTHEGTLPG